MNRLQKCLANNMKRYRRICGLSQEKLAEKAGASANYIALIESGRSFPSLQMLNRIAEALDIDSLELFDKKSLDFVNLQKLRTDLIEHIEQIVNDALDTIEQ